MTARVCLGAFAGAHGVKGEAKVKTFTAKEEGVARYGPVETEDGLRRLNLEFVRVLKPGVALVRSPDIKSREEAAALAGVRFYVERGALPPAGEEEFYIDDLIGLAVRDDQGAALGIVAAAHNFGAGDILEVKRNAGAALLVPFTRAAIPHVDLPGGTLTVSAQAIDATETDAALVAEAMRQEDA